MGRYELLRTLDEQGVNDFGVFRLDEARGPRRFPVFLRAERDHRGPRTGLLGDAAALREAIAALEGRGESRNGKIVVEFCDTRGADGLYRKYAAWRIGDRIVPQHVFVSSRWMVKAETNWLFDGDAPDRRRLLAEERRYLDENPHEAPLRRAFALAGIEFGRADYGVVNGSLRVWEINTNPDPFFGRDSTQQERNPLILRPGERVLQEAILALDAGRSPGRPVAIAEPRPLAPRLRAAAARRLRRPLRRLGLR